MLTSILSCDDWTGRSRSPMNERTWNVSLPSWPCKGRQTSQTSCCLWSRRLKRVVGAGWKSQNVSRHENISQRSSFSSQGTRKSQQGHKQGVAHMQFQYVNDPYSPCPRVGRTSFSTAQQKTSPSRVTLRDLECERNGKRLSKRHKGRTALECPTSCLDVRNVTDLGSNGIDFT